MLQLPPADSREAIPELEMQSADGPSYLFEVCRRLEERENLEQLGGGSTRPPNPSGNPLERNLSTGMRLDIWPWSPFWRGSRRTVSLKFFIDIQKALSMQEADDSLRSQDLWIATDKAQHLVFCATVSLSAGQYHLLLAG